MADFSSDTTASGIAKVIYDISTECLMAHSIRAIEHHLREQYDFTTTIVLCPSKYVLSDSGRLSWCSVALNTGDPTYIFYQDDPDLDKTRKRFCIAHELYHVIWSAENSDNGGAVVARDLRTESACDIFANSLCTLHDEFYKEEATRNNGGIRFHGLPYRSV